jgi:hypothetical protein
MGNYSKYLTRLIEGESIILENEDKEVFELRYVSDTNPLPFSSEDYLLQILHRGKVVRTLCENDDTAFLNSLKEI